MGCGSSSPPQADPNIGLAEKEQADLAQQQQAYFQANFAPELLSEMKQQTALSQQQADKEGQLQDYELGLSKQYNDRYWNTAVPLQDQMIQQAKNYNSDAEWDHEAGQAAGDVQQSFANSQAQMGRQLSGMGIDAGSAGSVAAMGDLQTQRALAQAGAMNRTRDAARQLGWQRMGEATALTSGLPGFSGGSANMSMGAGQAAMGAGGAGLGAVGTGAQVAGQSYNSAAGMWNNVGNLGVGSYNAAVNAYSAQGGGLGSMMSGIGGLMQGYGYMTTQPSSKRLKTHKRTVSDSTVLRGLSESGGSTPGAAALRGLNKLSVATWKYKPGVGDEGRHVGPYAEDVQQQFGDRVAPGGKAIHMGAMGQINMRAIQQLSTQLQKMKAELAALEAA